MAWEIEDNTLIAAAGAVVIATIRKASKSIKIHNYGTGELRYGFSAATVNNTTGMTLETLLKEDITAVDDTESVPLEIFGFSQAGTDVRVMHN